VKDYDAERQQRHKEREQALGDRQFKLGGEIFTYRANVSYDVLRRLTSDAPLTGSAYIDAIELSCLEMIEDDDDAHKRFIALSSRDKDPVTLEDLQAVFSGLVEDAFKRPTQASLPSGVTDAATGTSSTETPSTAPAEALVA
jgi:hypothetical protein